VVQTPQSNDFIELEKKGYTALTGQDL
jgi:hypothetical protein